MARRRFARWSTMMALVVAGCSSPPHAADLGGGDGADMAGDGVLHLAPQSIALARRAIQQFTASLPVRWSVDESGGGDIDDSGRYVAPNAQGTFHVTATTTDAPVQTATATITVEDRSLVLVAGSLGGDGNADDLAGAARLHGPTGVAGDGAGTLYFVDTLNQLVRKLDVATGAVTTIAGARAHTLGAAGSDGIGAAARFNRPWSLALDGAGHAYVGDVGDQTIRAIDLATGAVTTLAGTPSNMGGLVDGVGPAARFNRPYALVADGKGALYVADANNSAVRKVDLASRAVTTVSTAFSAPMGLAYDGADALYVADGGNGYVVDKLTLSTKAVALVAGESGVGGFRDGSGSGAHFYAPGALQLDGAGNLWVADIWLRKVVLATGKVTTAAEQSYDGAAAAGGGALYLTSYGDDVVVRFDPTTSARTVLAGKPRVAGNVDATGSAAAFDLPLGLAADGSGTLWVADGNNQELRTVDGSGVVHTVSGAATGTPTDGSGIHARFGRIWGVASDGAGTLFLSETFSQTIRKFDIASGTVTTIAGARNVAGVRDGAGADARFQDATGLCYDGAGALYIADTDSHTIRKLVVQGGVVTTLAGFAEAAGSGNGALTDARFRGPGSIACAGSKLYVADSQNDTIRLVDLGSSMVSTVAGAAGVAGYVDDVGTAARFDAPDYIVLDGTRLVVADRNGAHVRAIALPGFAVTTLATMPGSLGIIGLTVDGAGNVYVSDRNHTIKKIAPGGAITLVAGSPNADGTADGTGSGAQFDGPHGLTFDGAGGLFLVEDWDGTVRRVALADGKVTTLAGAGPFHRTAGGVGSAAYWHSPYGVAFDGAGAMLVSDPLGWVVGSLDTTTATLSLVAGNPTSNGSGDGTGTGATFDRPGYVAYDGAGMLYVADWFDHTVRRVAVKSGEVLTIAGTAGKPGAVDANAADARFNGPSGVAWDGAGRLFVADRGNHTIRAVDGKSGAVTTFAGAAGMPGSADGVGSAARFDGPTALAYDASKGVLYVSDANNGTIRRIEAATAAVSTWAGVPGQSGVALGPLPARLNAPRGLALMPNGDLAISDENAVLLVH